MEKKLCLLSSLIFLIFINITFSEGLNFEKEFSYFINNLYEIPSEDSYININLDEYVEDKVLKNTIKYYKILLLNDSEEVFFDFQSEYGCLNISFVEEEEEFINSSYQFSRCAEGKNNIFNISKNEILNKVEERRDTIKDLTIIIGVGDSNSEIGKIFNFDYALKVSLRKPDVNIFKINSEHKILSKTEKVNEEIYRSLFIVDNNHITENNQNLIIYSISQKNNGKLNIFADYINKEEYDNWNKEFLVNNIPNISSNYTNYNTENDFIIIQNLNKEKYLYISIESNYETTIELFSQILPDEQEVIFPKSNNIQIYHIKNSTNIKLDFIGESLEDKLSIFLTTLYGKASIFVGSDKSSQYITDIRENKLLLMIDLNSCYKNNDRILEINLLEQDVEKELGYIFIISFSKNTKNILKELTYGKSNKLSYNPQQDTIMMFEQLPEIKSGVNINLQIYNIPEKNNITTNFFDIRVFILPFNDIYKLKLDYSYINNFKFIKNGNFSSFLSAANIYLTEEEIKKYLVDEDSCLLIYISIKDQIIKYFSNFIIGSTVSEINSLIYPSERIYHYGKYLNEEKIVYKLKGNTNYHLMRLEFGCNSDVIGWSVKRTNNNESYMKNDTDLSFVTERWSNGRELLTMYIENGEDIYLTIFPKDKIDNTNFVNYIFKYINSAKNGDFKNYIVKYDSLNYDVNNKIIDIKKLKNVPYSFESNYYLKIINENDYIKNEELNTIAITDSYNSFEIKGKTKDDNIHFELSNIISTNNSYYVNAYSTVIENNSDIEYLSYSSFRIEAIKIIDDDYYLLDPETVKTLFILSIIIASLVFLIILIRCTRYWYKECY